MVFKGDWVPKSYHEDVPGWKEELFDMLEVIVLEEAPPRSGALSIEMEHEESHLHDCLGGVYPTLEDVARLTMLPLLGDANAIGIVLEMITEG